VLQRVQAAAAVLAIVAPGSLAPASAAFAAGDEARAAGLSLWVTGQSGSLPIASAGRLVASGFQVTNQGAATLRDVRLTVRLTPRLHVAHVYVVRSPGEPAPTRTRTARNTWTWEMRTLGPHAYVALDVLASPPATAGRVCAGSVLAVASGYRPVKLALPCFTLVDG